LTASGIALLVLRIKIGGQIVGGFVSQPREFRVPKQIYLCIREVCTTTIGWKRTASRPLGIVSRAVA